MRREASSRIIASGIQILEWEGMIAKGELQLSTLQECLSKLGYSTGQMKMYHEKSEIVRRFHKRRRTALWHSDIKYGPYFNNIPKYGIWKIKKKII